MIDTTTVLLMSGLITIVCTVVFVLNNAFGRLDGVGLYWSASLMFAIVSSLAFAVAARGNALWWANATGNPAIVVAMGCVWLGVRRYNGRRSLAWPVYIIGALVCVATFLDSPESNEWAGAPVSWIGIAAFTLAAAAECFTGRLRKRTNAYILAVVLIVEGGFYLARLIVFYAAGPASHLFLGWFRTAATTSLAVLLVVAGTLAVSVLRIERTNELVESGGYSRAVFSSDGVLDWAHFRRSAADRIDRASANGVSSGVVIVAIDSLTEINSVFGRAVGDRAVRHLAQVLRDTMPPTAIIGRRSTARFAVVTTMDDPLESESTLARLQNALVERAVDPDAGLRLTVSVGLVTARGDEEQDWPTMLALATERCDEAKTHGGNLVVGVRS